MNLEYLSSVAGLQTEMRFYLTLNYFVMQEEYANKVPECIYGGG